MMPMDPPLRVGPAIPPVAPATATIALDRRLSAGSLSVGQEVGARVLSDRAGGRFVALIEGRAVEVVLPQGARAGDALRLIVTADQPRLVLAPKGEAAAGAGAGAGASGPAAARAAAEAGLAGGRAVLPQAEGDVSVSAGGRALSGLVGEIASAAAKGGGAAGAADAEGLQGTRGPLVAVPAAGGGALAGQLAAALARTFAGSGLFYESHQAQWVAGERSLESLRQEPQGKLVPLPVAGQGTSAGETPGARPTAPDAARLPPPAARDPAPLPGTPATAPAGSSLLAGVVDPSTAGLVQQQLAALDAGSAGWSGFVLPGMQARITVQERPPPSDDEREPGPDEASDWSTRIAVVLPRLGSIDAQLVLRGDRLLVSVAAGASSSVDELAMARQQLVEALAAAGLTVESLRVDER